MKIAKKIILVVKLRKKTHGQDYRARFLLVRVGRRWRSVWRDDSVGGGEDSGLAFLIFRDRGKSFRKIYNGGLGFFV